jgi:hypothetical protein
MSFDAHKQQAVAKVRFYTPFEVSVRVKHDAPRRSVRRWAFRDARLVRGQERGAEGFCTHVNRALPYLNDEFVSVDSREVHEYRVLGGVT